MSAASNILENLLLDHLFGKGAYTPPTNLKVGLASAADDDSYTEVVYTGYARVTTAPANWTASVDGIIKNSSAIVFPEVFGGSDTANSIIIFDENDVYLMHGLLDSALSIIVGMTPSFAINFLEISLD